MESGSSSAQRRNRVELSGTVVSEPQRRTSPAGTPVATFRLRVEPDPRNPAIAGCEIHVVRLGAGSTEATMVAGDAVLVEGALTERRWTRAGMVHRRFEVVAAAVKPMASRESA